LFFLYNIILDKQFTSHDTTVIILVFLGFSGVF